MPRRLASYRLAPRVPARPPSLALSQPGTPARAPEGRATPHTSPRTSHLAPRTSHLCVKKTSAHRTSRPPSSPAARSMAAAPRRDALPPPLKGAETTKVVTTCLVASRLSALRLRARPPSLAVGEPGTSARAPEGRATTALKRGGND